MSSLLNVTAAITAHQADLLKPGVLSVRPGFKLLDGWPSDQPAIVVVVDPAAAAPVFPLAFDGIAIDVRPATEVELYRFKNPVEYQSLAVRKAELRPNAFPEIGVPPTPVDVVAAAKPQVPYSAPPGVSLSPLTGRMTITCHASPDAGWPTLRDFFSETQNKLVVGLYDFTAQHILNGLKTSLQGGRTLTLTLDNPSLNPTADQSDTETIKELDTALSQDLTAAWALVRSNKAIPRWIYPTAYHIKVAVRDGSAVWLSSGNWNNSNLPNMDPINSPSADDQKRARRSDRDFHVVIEQPELASLFEAYLLHDNEVATAEGPAPAGLLAVQPEALMPENLLFATTAAWRFYPPLRIEDELMTITPLLTPDAGVYQQAILQLINSAEHRLYIQLQYIHPSDLPADDGLTELIDAVADQINAGLDVRIILSQYQASNGWLERLKGAGVDLSVVRLQNGVHNKAFIVDSRVVALGSQNWSGDGVLRNRDASVIIDHKGAATYYEKLFLHDWFNVARQKVSPAAEGGLHRTRITAVFMHETEEAASLAVIQKPEVTTESFVLGEVEERHIEELRDQGIVVREERTTQARQVGPRVATTAKATVGLQPGLPPEAIPAAEDFYFLKVRGPLLESRRAALESNGAVLVERRGHLGYAVKLDDLRIPDVNALDFVEGLRWMEPSSSLPKIVSRSVRAAGGQALGARKMLTFDVRLREPGGKAVVTAWLDAHHVAIAGSGTRKIRIYALEDSPDVDELSRLPEVDTITEYIRPKVCNDVARRLLGIDGGQQPLKQDGTGQVVGIADTGIDDGHPDLQGRNAGRVARGRQSDTTDPNGHGTHVAGSIIGDGTASGGSIRGIAPKANLYFQSLLDDGGELGGLPVDLNDLFDEAYQAGVRIHNNSWGSATGSQYTMNSEEVDEFVWNHPDMLIVIAAGNEGTSAAPRKAGEGFVDWLSVGSPASSKNALTVGASRSSRSSGGLSTFTWLQRFGARFPKPPIAQETISGNPDAMAAFSSRGPCDDRRIKPDLVAPGTDILSTKSSLAPISNYWGSYPTVPNDVYAYDGGTSMAAPLAAGCAVLVRQYFVDERGHPPSAALLKATLVNSTTWLSGTDADAPTRGRPNYHQGHGRINIRRAIPNADQPNLRVEFVDDWQNVGKAFTGTGQRRRFRLTLPAATELRVAMAYTDPPARGLQNNLNLIVQHRESNRKWLGNEELPDSLTVGDSDNNLESVRISSAPAGTYFIQVYVANLLRGPVHFALVVTGDGLPPLLEI